MRKGRPWGPLSQEAVGRVKRKLGDVSCPAWSGASARESDAQLGAWSQVTAPALCPEPHLKADDFLTAFVPPRVRIQDAPLSNRAEKWLQDKQLLSD